jgi:hypothetical protein
MVRSIIGAIGQMIAQWAAYQIIQATVGASGATAAATSKTLEAQGACAMAGLNAFSSTGAIPVDGPGLAPGAAAAAIAATQPMAAAVAALYSASSSGYAGAFDKGGMIPAGKWGIAGEYGPEIIQGPAAVTSRTDTAKMLGSQPMNVNININTPDADSFRASIGQTTAQITRMLSRAKRNM